MDAAGNIQTGFRYFVRQYPLLTAFTTNFAVQGTMAMMMAMTAYTLDVHGHALPMISFAVALHVMGMFGLSLPLGKLSDRYGRRPLMMAGVVHHGDGIVADRGHPYILGHHSGNGTGRDGLVERNGGVNGAHRRLEPPIGARAGPWAPATPSPLLRALLCR